MNSQQKNDVLKSLAQLLSSSKQQIIDTNVKEVALYANLDPSLLDRLKLTDAKVDGMVDAINKLIEQDDPEETTLCMHTTRWLED